MMDVAQNCVTWSTWLLLVVAMATGQFLTQPEQVHLSYGSTPEEMTVSWVTQTYVNVSVVQYGTEKLDKTAVGKPIHFVDGGSAHRGIWIHKVTLKNLKPGQTYLYHVGSSFGWSEIFSFKAMQDGTAWSPRLLVYGDLGNVNAVSLGRIQEEAERGQVDAILHAGDFAYDFDTDDGRVGDAFMNQIQPVAAYVPYMTSVGNHEAAYNFSHYKNRFSMPGGSGDNIFYSFNMGPAHIIAFSTEVYFYESSEQYGWMPIVNQYRWLEQDLTEANKPENRALRPWIITVGHKPMYCSNLDKPSEFCNNPDNIIRTGIPSIKAYGLEDVFYKYGVDLQFYAHEHSYERLWPVYKRKVCNGTLGPYINPSGPVHVVTGAAGNQEGQTSFDKVLYPWSAFHSRDYGYTRMNIINATHLYLEQVSDDKGGAVIDKMMLIKETHGAGLYNCHL